jgi:hypothetical protein
MNKQLYKCECCGKEFPSGRPRHGERLCSDCIEIRRYLRPYAKRLGVGQVLARAGKLLLPYAEKKEK